MKVGYQGIEGAYSETACLQFFGNHASLVGYNDFACLIEALKDDAVDAIALPVENSTTGIIFLTMDLVRSETQLYILGETYVTIDHCLMAKEPISLSEISLAYSHSEALKQCSRFLKSHGILPLPYEDTASAARFISQNGKKGECAIASRSAAKQYQLYIIQSHIQDIAANTTRFLIFSKRKNLQGDKTTLYFETPHRPGALLKILNLFAVHSINMTSLHSRPAMDHSLFEYGFFLEVSANLLDEKYRGICDHIQQFTDYVNFMGVYPAAIKDPVE